MPLSKTKIGPFEIYSVESGRFRLDGGAMFGVVPKTLWQRSIEPDEKNRILMAMRCMLIKSGISGKIYLVDNGTGTKFDEKMSRIYDLDYDHSDLVGSLEACDVLPDDITDIIFTHLHFDHCGGTTYYDQSGNLQHRFKNARYHVNRRHLDNAMNPNAREKASFLNENIDPISTSERLHTVEDLHEFEEGLTTLTVEGHTIGQQLPVIEGAGKKLVYAADLIPTHVHVPLPWIMGYDMQPLKTLAEKENFLKLASANGWYLFLEHDAEHEIITIREEKGRYSVGKTLTLTDL